MNPADSRVVLSSGDALARFHGTDPTGDAAGVYYVEFDHSNWSTPVIITVAARNDSAPEDPHNTAIIHSIDLNPAHTTDTAYNATHTITENGSPVVIPNVIQ